jgi:two-component system, NarL family, sensor histidine kinase UhpB
VNWRVRFGWAVLAVVTLVIALGPVLVTLPKPQNALVLDRAEFYTDKGDRREVTLPHAVKAQVDDHPQFVTYKVGFDLQSLPGTGLYLYIPSINRRVSLKFAGETFYGFESSSFWIGPWVSASVMVRVPVRMMVVGRNELALTVETGPYVMPAYISELYLAREADLAPYYKLRTAVDSQLKIMSFAAHALLGFGLIFAYFFRPNDPLFAWLALLNAVSLLASVALFTGFHPTMQYLFPVIASVSTAASPLVIGFAFCVINVRPSRKLKIAAVVVPLLFLPLSLMPSMFPRIILSICAAGTMIVGFVTAAAILGWGAFRQKSVDAGLLFPPAFLWAWFSIHDVFVTVTVPEHGYNLLFAHARPLMLALVTAVLMHRMGISLDQLDRANETLGVRLAEREAELAALYREEKVKTARLVRDQERQRLTHDLHDGISGHLVSIIALSERAGEGVRPIEQAARDALDDLRLVIYSLDLGDSELPLALANFRERLAPQLQRLGIELDWSTANLPEVSGVTPGNALAVLRIVQEAITNAVKHGPARKITVRGSGGPEGGIAITVENDGNGISDENGVNGRGLANMRRRAQELQGRLIIDSGERWVKVTLLLPSRLPEFAEQSVV